MYAIRSYYAFNKIHKDPAKIRMDENTELKNEKTETKAEETIDLKLLIQQKARNNFV